MGRKQPAIAEGLQGCGNASVGCGCVIMMVLLLIPFLAIIGAMLGAAGAG